MLNDIGVPPLPPRDDSSPPGHPPGPPVGPAASAGRTHATASTTPRPGYLPHAGDVIVNGTPVVLNPPVEPDIANDTPRAHVEDRQPGRHHARTVGDETKIDPIYAMPMEDRGSTFSITLSIVVIVVFIVLLAVVLVSVYR
ncbi:MAG TPA: hypothetical protein VF624_12175 [Tepidisphaeraceae bacterium]|jgi:hypothetical protein